MAETMTMESELGIPKFTNLLSGREVLKEDIEISVDNKNPPKWVYETFRSATNLLTLRKSWDTYGADVISEDAVKNTLESLFSFCGQSTPLPSLVPLSTGKIQVEWHSKGKDLELEIDDAGIANLFYCDNTEEIELNSPSAEQVGDFVGRISR